MPIEFGRTFHVPTLPLFLDHICHLSPGQAPLVRQVMFVSHNKYWNIVHVPALQNLFTQGFNVLEAVFRCDIIHENVRGRVSESIAAEIRPFIERVHREVGNVGTVDDFEVIQVVVDDDGGIVQFPLVRGLVVFCEIVVDKLFSDRGLSHPWSS